MVEHHTTCSSMITMTILINYQGSLPAIPRMPSNNPSVDLLGQQGQRGAQGVEDVLGLGRHSGCLRCLGQVFAL